ncbi:hypothetical protein SEPCBS57363_001326 [Sporothrix epigloea]|uniref:Uncharacterized protein n=1 Tax=Sporothrix epigloea TaxID=1892477 RepID=A0ABP0D9L4_9PEZI
MSSLFGPCLARTPSPASLLLEVWATNAETKKLVDKLLGATDGKQPREDELKRRLAAFDCNMSVLSTVVTAIKTMKKTSSSCVMLDSSAGSMPELSIPKRDSITSEKNRLLGLVFFQDEDDVAWGNINLIHSIDAITALECRRRQDLDAIADKLNHRKQHPVENTQQTDSALNLLEQLIAQNAPAQYLFKTFFLGARICTICHHFKSNTKAEFTMQLLNALFPPYLVSYPVPCIDVKDVRTVREKVYIALLDAETRFGGGDGKARAEAFQNDLLSQIGIGSWPAEIWPALSGYLAFVESVKVTYGEVFSSQKKAGLDMSETPALIFKEERLRSRSDSATELSQVGVKSIFKNSLSSASGQSFSTYASSYSFVSEPMMHGMAKLDEQELIRMGLSSPSSNSHRSGQTSFDSSKSSPLELISASFKHTSAGELCAASIQNAQPMAQNLGFPGTTSQATAIVVNAEDVLLTANLNLDSFEEHGGINQGCQEPNFEQNGEQSDQLNTVAFPPFPVSEAMKPTLPPKGQSAQQTPITPSERTKRLIKSGWKSTENLFSKFRAHEQVAGGVPTIPHMPVDRLSSFSQRRPSNRTASGIASTISSSDNGRGRADSNSSAGGGCGAHVAAADFILPYVPDGVDVDSELIPEQPAGDSEQHENCSRVQVDRELYEYAEGRLCTIDRESAHQVALQEQVMVEANKQNGSKNMDIAKKCKQPGASASANAGAAMAVVLPDSLPPPPSAISKAWSSLKKGTGKMLLTRKSTFDLREVAEKMAPPPPLLSQRGDSNNTIDNSEESDDSGLRKPEAKVNGQVRHLTEPLQKDKKYSQEEMWDLLSIRPPKKRPLKLTPLHISTASQDRASVASKNSARGLSFCETGPVSPPPQSPLPPLPLSRAASRSNQTGNSIESNSIITSVKAGDMISILSSHPSGSSDIFDEYFEHECQHKTSLVLEDEGALNDISETVASSPESHVARGSRGARTGSSIQQLEKLSTMLNGVIVEDKVPVLVDEIEKQADDGKNSPANKLLGEPN